MTSDKKQKEYALYNDKDEFVTLGTDRELAKFLGRDLRVFRTSLSKVRCGKTKTLASSEYGDLTVHEIED